MRFPRTPYNPQSSAQRPAAHDPGHSVAPQKLRAARNPWQVTVKRWWWLIVILILALVIGVLTYGYLNTKNELKKLSNPQTAGRTEVQKIVAQVGKSIDLPKDETPTLATVNDASKLKNQTFFRNAQNGDKVLIYTKAGRALLYRPSTQKVIEYAPVDLGANQP